MDISQRGYQGESVREKPGTSQKYRTTKANDSLVKASRNSQHGGEDVCRQMTTVDCKTLSSIGMNCRITEKLVITYERFHRWVA